MPRFLCKILLFMTWCSASGCMASVAHLRGPATAFFYDQDPPVDLLRPFEQVVLDPEAVPDASVRGLADSGVRVLAYLSVGEVEPSRPWDAEVRADWVLGRNDAWGSRILDPRRTEVHALILRLARRYQARGFGGLFLDTLDSYQSIVRRPEHRFLCEQALIDLLRTLRRELPSMQLVGNRGFELMPTAAPLLDGLVAESLFAGFDPRRRRYRAVPEADRRWLLPRLKQARSLGLPVIVVDYLPAGEHERAHHVARLIADEGFIPWVGSALHDTMGMGLIEPVKRRVLVLFDDEDMPIESSEAHLRLGPILDHLGLLPRFLPIHGPLPEGVLHDRYAGAILYLRHDEVRDAERLKYWLGRCLKNKFPLVILGRLGFAPDAAFMQLLGLGWHEDRLEGPLVSGGMDRSLVGFEAAPEPLARDLWPWFVEAPGLHSALPLNDARGRRLDPLVVGSFGALVQAPLVFRLGLRGRQSWIINPFELLRRALRLPEAPVPDVTTENGSRLLTVHIDGDGFASRADLPGAPFSGEALQRQILERYRLPTTVSIVEGEIGPTGMHPHLAPRLMSVARGLFRLPHIEPASHTFSHPFDWRDAAREPAVASFHLPIPGYSFDLRREIEGSVRFIDGHLAQKNKPVRVFLWSGDCVPTVEAVGMTRALGLCNVNGGDTRITRDHPSLTRVGPMLREVEGGVQVYAPMTNENVYTNLWRGPFWGYIRVLETFELTDQPRRLKPMAIYYHHFSGTKRASLRALERVYEAALRADPMPVFLSEYAMRVEKVLEVSVARRLDGAWELYYPKFPRTVRLHSGWPDLVTSTGVAGVTDLPQGRYLSLDGSGRAAFAVIEQPPSTPYLRQANAKLLRWEPQAPGRVAFRLAGHVPLRIVLDGLRPGCRVVGGVRPHRIQIRASQVDSSQVDSSQMAHGPQAQDGPTLGDATQGPPTQEPATQVDVTGTTQGHMTQGQGHTTQVDVTGRIRMSLIYAETDSGEASLVCP